MRSLPLEVRFHQNDVGLSGDSEILTAESIKVVNTTSSVKLTTPGFKSVADKLVTDGDLSEFR